MTEEVNNTEATEEAAPVQLSLADLSAAVQIIDAASKRGTFEGGELESVGGVRNRLATFVEASQPAPTEEEGEEDSDSEVAEEASAA